LLAPILAPLIVGLTLAVIVLLAALAFQGRRIGELDRRLDRLTRGSDGLSLESSLASGLERIEVMTREVDQLAARSAVSEVQLRSAIQRVGLVRFNPFEETGGNQSFALALLDEGGNGFVISSLHARSGTRIYAKALTGGRADTALSAEETEAVRIALGGSRQGRG
jgi:hypothetical protein